MASETNEDPSLSPCGFVVMLMKRLLSDQHLGNPASVDAFQQMQPPSTSLVRRQRHHPVTRRRKRASLRTWPRRKRTRTGGGGAGICSAVSPLALELPAIVSACI